MDLFGQNDKLQVLKYWPNFPSRSLGPNSIRRDFEKKAWMDGD